jgi:hypothetical protein
VEGDMLLVVAVGVNDDLSDQIVKIGKSHPIDVHFLLCA